MHDVIEQPVFEVLGHGRAIVLLEPGQDTPQKVVGCCQQFLMLGFMAREAGVTAILHQPFFIGEVLANVQDQAVETEAERGDIVAFVKRLDQRVVVDNQLPMLRIDVWNPDVNLCSVVGIKEL